LAEDSGEKTESPTQRRREQAREDGNLLTSRELATALAGAAGAVWLWSFGSDLFGGARVAMQRGLRLSHAQVEQFLPAEALLAMVRPMMAALGALFAMVVLAAVAGRAITGGLTFNPGLWAPRSNRISPTAGLQRMFGRQGLVELVKAVLKTALLIGLAVLLIIGEMSTLAQLSAMQFDAAVATVARLAVRLILWLTLGLVLIAGADLPVQILQWLQKMRMTKQEVRDEFKQQEGSPEVRHAIRRMARENLKRANRALIADATVVLTNPTHFAVALRYRPGVDAAPVIVARGRGLMADVIRELAAEQKILILAYPVVARAIYFTGKVGAMIRPELYVAVATILAFVLRVGAELAGEEPPEVEVPPAVCFDEHGHKAAAHE
jgi:flagellar biosynthetic protein FlhB